MKKRECDALIDAYVAWLKRGLSVETVGDACELTTPFLDRHNDHVQIYALKRGSRILLTDDGYTLNDLAASGFYPNTEKRIAVLDSILNGFGVRMDDRSIVAEANPTNLGQRIHTLIQALLAVNDMFAMAQKRETKRLFYEEVIEWFDELDVRYTQHVKLAGFSGMDHTVDFLIPKSKKQNDRVVKVMNAPTESAAQLFLFAVEDIRKARKTRAQGAVKAVALLNDAGKAVPADVFEALKTYDVAAASWSDRVSVSGLLAA